MIEETQRTGHRMNKCDIQTDVEKQKKTRYDGYATVCIVRLGQQDHGWTEMYEWTQIGNVRGTPSSSTLLLPGRLPPSTAGQSVPCSHVQYGPQRGGGWAPLVQGTRVVKRGSWQVSDSHTLPLPLARCLPLRDSGLASRASKSRDVRTVVGSGRPTYIPLCFATVR